MSDEQTSFKVTDRRLFNPDGTPREVPEDERPEIKPEPEPPQASTEVDAVTATESAGPAAEVGGAEAAAEASPQDQPQAAAATAATAAPQTEVDPEAELPGAKDPASFANFMMSIASNAASSLGMMEHPVTGKREVDLELGKHWIDILGMLEQKTRGNLLPQEEQILEGLLADLRMQYVSLTNVAPKARTYTSRDITGG